MDKKEIGRQLKAFDQAGALLRSTMRAYWKIHKGTGMDIKNIDLQLKAFDQALTRFLYSGSLDLYLQTIVKTCRHL